MGRLMRRLIAVFMRFFFKHLYTTISWCYDFVAWASSMGQWRAWQHAALIEFKPGLILEIGHGPGHVLLDFIEQGRKIVGVDASQQMTRIANRKLQGIGAGSVVVQGQGQFLPFKQASFSGVVATFPSEYILDLKTLANIHRVLEPAGNLVIIGLSTITGKGLHDRFAAWLYWITGLSDNPEHAFQNWISSIEDVGFNTRIEIESQPRADVLRLVAAKITD
jgi:ubiquinone/menaquinone biosynthesis C-methylase UbiE